MSKKTIFGLMAGLVLLSGGVLLWNEEQNKTFQTNYVTLTFENLPTDFDGYRIVQLSDLHGNHPQGLLEAVASFQPDLIACTGDIYDGVRYAPISDQILKDLVRIAPVYFISGNHEYYAGNWRQRSLALEKMGVHVIDNQCVKIEKNDSFIELCGLADPDFHSRWDFDTRLEQFKQEMAMLPLKDEGVFRILLSHRADLFEYSWPVEADLTLSGHLHGGHWRLFGKGLIAPNNGDGIVWFPKYDGGYYNIQGHHLFVSRGMGDQMKIPRLFNPPELICLTLKKV